jgi:hypothetical protein
VAGENARHVNSSDLENEGFGSMWVGVTEADRHPVRREKENDGYGASEVHLHRVRSEEEKDSEKDDEKKDSQTGSQKEDTDGVLEIGNKLGEGSRGSK